MPAAPWMAPTSRLRRLRSLVRGVSGEEKVGSGSGSGSSSRPLGAGATWESRLALRKAEVYVGKDGITESPAGMKSIENAPLPRLPTAQPRAAVQEAVDVAIVGAGFSGLGLAKRLLESGVTKVRLLERGSDAGGTWFWNRYPDAACDSMTHSYSYSFERDWKFTQNYAKQPELYGYARFIASKYDLYSRTLFDATVTTVDFDADSAHWSVCSDVGDRITARFVVLANGPLTEPQLPDLPGLNSFKGQAIHTARWDETFSAAGKRVAVIGTGTSAVQTIPKIAEAAGHLTVFQRTPVYCVPKADGLVDPEWHHKLHNEEGWMAKVRADYWENADEVRQLAKRHPRVCSLISARSSSPSSRRITKCTTQRPMPWSPLSCASWSKTSSTIPKPPQH